MKKGLILLEGQNLIVRPPCCGGNVKLVFSYTGIGYLPSNYMPIVPANLSEVV
jgi:hypothetical protein